jgi:hypothetical protein
MVSTEKWKQKLLFPLSLSSSYTHTLFFSLQSLAFLRDRMIELSRDCRKRRRRRRETTKARGKGRERETLVKAEVVNARKDSEAGKTSGMEILAYKFLDAKVKNK